MAPNIPLLLLTISLALLLLPPLPIVAIHPDALQPFLDRGSTYSLVSFRLAGEVADLQRDFLAAATRNSAKMLEGLKVAAKQTGKELDPPEWILVDLITTEGDEEEVESTVAVRNDNLYIVGATDDEHGWHCFAGTETLINGCSRLGFNSDYDGVNGMMARNDLINVPLGRAALEKAVRDMRGYRANQPLDGAAPTTEASMKLAMATAALTISEGARFTYVSALLKAGWESGTRLLYPERLVYWSRISCALAKGWVQGTAETVRIAIAFGIQDGIAGKEWAAGLLNVAIYGRACEKEIDALL
nr:60 kDa jasmonate-induced protein-like [Lolium perenne]